LNLFPKGPPLIGHSTWWCWKGLLMSRGTSEESYWEIAHSLFTLSA
jgi:hypothetical protein